MFQPDYDAANDAFGKSLNDFMALGADIIATDAGKRYGFLYKGVLLQPGFMPVEGYPKLCFIGINPSSNKPIDYDAECALYELWEMDRTLEAYKDAYERWLGNFPQWPVSAAAISLLVKANLGLRDLAWLNVSKVRDTNSMAITESLARQDFSWLKKQLAFLGPDVFVVLGSSASRYAFIVDYLIDHYGKERIGVRGQRGAGESIDDIAARLKRWLHRDDQ